jgi:integrase
MAVKVRERKGAWWVFVDHKGRRKAKRVGVGKGGKRAAESAAEKIQAKLALGDLSSLEGDPPKAVAFREYVETWSRSVAAYLKPSTQDNYSTAMRLHWLPDLGARLLTAITRDDLTRIIATKREREHLRLSSVHTAIIPLRACFNAAVRDGLLTRNPATHLLRGSAGTS